ncbi:hypothetical protein VTL71DRAFT_446 [Oculimacula yallundae]|uniref:Uncharacterized protein n=1 Tax=Oculimacula yallundae TaxID=86028 RepID=A0ABR4D1K7_9HELO
MVEINRVIVRDANKNVYNR